MEGTEKVLGHHYKIYAIILIGIIIGFAIAYVVTSGFGLVEEVPDVTNPTEASSALGELGQGLGNITSGLEDIEDVLG